AGSRGRPGRAARPPYRDRYRGAAPAPDRAFSPPRRIAFSRGFSLGDLQTVRRTPLPVGRRRLRFARAAAPGSDHRPKAEDRRVDPPGARRTTAAARPGDRVRCRRLRARRLCVRGDVASGAAAQVLHAALPGADWPTPQTVLTGTPPA